jgi:hypothetical protein
VAEEEKVQEAQESAGQQQDSGATWPKEVRDAWLKKTQEFSERLGSLEQQLYAVNYLAQQLAELKQALSQNQSQSHLSPSSTQPSSYDGELDFDPWDDNSRRSFVKRLKESLVNEIQKQLLDRVYQEVFDRVRAASVLSSYVALSPYLLSKRYPGVEFDVEKLLEEASKRGTYDLESVFKDLYGEELKKREIERLRKEWEQEQKSKSAAGVTSAPAPVSNVVNIPKEVPQTREGLIEALRSIVPRR